MESSIAPNAKDFSLLDPFLVADAVSEAYNLDISSSFSSCPSYINRVFELSTENKKKYIAKFYRPNRWPYEAILEEHAFVHHLKKNGAAVCAPIIDSNSESLQTLVLESGDGSLEGDAAYHFALYEKINGHTFDKSGIEVFYSLGSALGKMHAAAKDFKLEFRNTLNMNSVRKMLEYLNTYDCIHDSYLDEYNEICLSTFETIEPIINAMKVQPIHGDFHRGNLIGNSENSFTIIDFDDLLIGPQVQDFWLLLPGAVEESRAELEAIIEGYSQYLNFDLEALKLVEPLRFIRMLHFLHWQAKQKNDPVFYRNFPDWGSKTFWKNETETMNAQKRRILTSLSS